MHIYVGIRTPYISRGSHTGSRKLALFGRCIFKDTGTKHLYIDILILNSEAAISLIQEVMRLNRPLKCCAGTPCCAAIDCCSHESTVEAPVGNVIGYIRQTSACCAFNFDIEDAGGRPVLEIQGPC
jgi:hypothetical protein